MPRDDLEVEVFDDELVVLDPVSGDLHHLDRHATIVWAAVDGTRTFVEVVDLVVDAVGGDREVIDRDVGDVLTHLDGAGLLG